MATCSGCRFHHETTCRRYPPQVTLMDVPTTNGYGEAIGHNFYGTQAWPNVEPDKDWCGEWQDAQPQTNWEDRRL